MYSMAKHLVVLSPTSHKVFHLHIEESRLFACLEHIILEYNPDTDDVLDHIRKKKD